MSMRVDSSPRFQDHSHRGFHLSSSSAWVIATAIVAISAVGAYLYYFKTPCELTSDFSNLQKPNQPKLNHSDTCDAIGSMTHFRGEPIEKIQASVEKHKTFGGRTFLEKLQQDCRSAQALGITNDEYADHLQALLDKASLESLSYAPFLINNIPIGNRLESFNYTPSLLENSSIGKCSGTQTYSVLPGSIDDSIAWGPSPIWNIFKDNIALDRKYEVIHNLDGQKLFINQMMIDHVRKYGFYDHTSPTELASFLTNHSMKEISSVTKVNVPEVNNFLLGAAKKICFDQNCKIFRDV